MHIDEQHMAPLLDAVGQYEDAEDADALYDAHTLMYERLMDALGIPVARDRELEEIK